MKDLIVPAPLWRRLAASSYDALLLIGVLVFGLVIAIIGAAAFKTLLAASLLWGGLFLLGFAFFGWSWTHGGQTLGMLPWRLRLRRVDGQSVRFPVALVRYGAMAVFGAVAGLGVLKGAAGNGFEGSLALGLASLDLWWCLIDSRGRAIHDLAAGTEVVFASRPAASD